MRSETIEDYHNHLILIRGLALGMMIIQIIAGLYYLIIPVTLKNSSFSRVELFAIGLVLILFSFLIAVRRVDNKEDRSMTFFRVITIGGIIHQYSLGLNTLFTVTFYTLALIGETLFLENITNIRRTQHFVSHEKLTPEVYNAVKNADRYIKGQLEWLGNTLLILGITAIISLIILIIIKTLPSIVTNIRFMQYIAFSAILLTIVLILVYGFPEVQQPISEYEIEY